MGDGPIVIGVWRKVIGGCILTTTHGLITIGLTTDGAILTTTGGPIIIGVITSTMVMILLDNVQSAPEGSTFTTVVHAFELFLGALIGSNRSYFLQLRSIWILKLTSTVSD